jgi:hypothetical protein
MRLLRAEQLHACVEIVAMLWVRRVHLHLQGMVALRVATLQEPAQLNSACGGTGCYCRDVRTTTVDVANASALLKLQACDEHRQSTPCVHNPTKIVCAHQVFCMSIIGETCSALGTVAPFGENTKRTRSPHGVLVTSAMQLTSLSELARVSTILS